MVRVCFKNQAIEVGQNDGDATKIIFKLLPSGCV
jgi:hypothetical protein